MSPITPAKDMDETIKIMLSIPAVLNEFFISPPSSLDFYPITRLLCQP
jgi:hypothetical protein